MEQTKSSSLRRERVLSHIADCWWLWILKAVIVLLVLCIIVPFFWMITSSVKTTQEYLTSPIVWFSRDPQWSNYAEVMVDLQFYRYIINSLILAALSVLLSVFSSAFVAFGFSRFNFKGSSVWFGIMIATMMLPGQVTVVPQFLLFKEIGWTKNFLPLVVPQICGAAGNVLLITQFMKGIPHEIDDAAKVDGAGSLTIFLRIMLPQIVPILIVTGLFTFLGSWKDSFGPLIYLRDESLYTVPLALMTFISPENPNRGILFTGLTIALVPTIIVYVLGQKYLENGIVIADLK